MPRPAPSRRRAAVTALLALAGLAAGCGSPAPPVRFQADGDVKLECMQHQTDPPGADYTDPERADLGRNLTVFKYYTLNGTVPYCDGAGPSTADVAWAQFVAQQTGSDRTVQLLLPAA